MTMRRRAALELVLAVAAVVGAMFSAAHVRAVVDVAPIAEGEPATTSVVFHAPPLVLTLLLVTVAGVLVVIGVARWRRSQTHTP
ncbi:MAG: rane protein [Mycobacterium sp.]|nr:rane protein [Mycobacterium sp.]